MITFESWLNEDLVIPNEEDSLGKKRHHMPQITGFDDFVEDLKSNKISMTTQEVNPDDYTPTQNNFNEEKVDKMIEENGWGGKPIIVSKDKFIVDGHHRWLAAAKLGENIQARVVDQDLEWILDFLKNKSYIEKKTIRE